MIPLDCQICLFSATIPPDMIKLSENFMNDPAKILVKKENLMLENILQYYLSCSNDAKKYENLFEIFANIDVHQCIIYVNTNDKAERLAQIMTEKEFKVSCIHDSIEQDKRSAVMREFREGASRILISTDLLARGIDIQTVGLIINFELPPKKENYIHRIGRSSRYRKRGIVINLISVHEASYLIEIQEFYHTHIPQLPTDLVEIQ